MFEAYQNTKVIPEASIKDVKINIDGHVKSVAKIKVNALSPLEKGVITSLSRKWNLGSLEVADYTFSNNFKGYLIRSADNSNSSLIIFF